MAKEISSVDRTTSLEIATTARGYEQAGPRPREMDAAEPRQGGPQPALLDGACPRRRRIITRQVDDMPGFPGQPMSRAGMDRKFRSNAGAR
ncbi:MAG TPA: hypothetical protein VK634_10205 [Reyranella sp.]|nr:hypothetical protein [Reyranella sp.]